MHEGVNTSRKYTKKEPLTCMKLFHAGGFRFFDENYILLDLLGFGSVQNWNNSGDMYNTDALRTLLFVDSLQFLFSAF